MKFKYIIKANLLILSIILVYITEFIGKFGISNKKYKIEG